jgi:phosphohistidine phosphatase
MADSCSLYLIRHAIAAERGDEYPADSKRPLTAHGISRFRKVAKGLAELDVEIDLVLSSPFARARQTADILSQQLRGHPPVVETPALTPGAAYQDLLAELGRHARVAGIVLVGHQPDIGKTAARLVGCPDSFDFRKGGVCRIDVVELPPSSPGRLRWFVPPKMLAGLHR